MQAQARSEFLGSAACAFSAGSVAHGLTWRNGKSRLHTASPLLDLRLIDLADDLPSIPKPVQREVVDAADGAVRAQIDAGYGCISVDLKDLDGPSTGTAPDEGSLSL